MNKIHLLGRLTKDPEFTRTASGSSRAKFSISVKRDFPTNGKYINDFLNCTAIDKNAENINKHLHKGSQVLITGSLLMELKVIRGIQNYVPDVIVQSIEFISNYGNKNNLDKDIKEIKNNNLEEEEYEEFNDFKQ